MTSTWERQGNVLVVKYTGFLGLRLLPANTVWCSEERVSCSHRRRDQNTRAQNLFGLGRLLKQRAFGRVSNILVRIRVHMDTTK